MMSGGVPLAAVELRSGTDAVAKTVADGAFQLEVGPGAHTLAITGAGVPFDCRWGPVRVAPGQTFELGEVIVPRPSSLRGQVVDEQGAAVAAAMVVSWRHAFGWSAQHLERTDPAHPPFAISDAEGRFRLESLGGPAASLLVERAGYSLRWQRFELAPGADLDVGKVVLTSGATRAGFVHGPNGAPIEGARILFGGRQPKTLWHRSAVVTDARGRYQLGPGPWEEVTVFADGFEPQCIALDRDGPLVRLSAANQVRGVVRGAEAHTGQMTVGRVPGDHDELPQWVDDVLTTPVPIAADGSFVIPCLPAGSWQCLAEVPGVGRSAFTGLTVPAPEPVVLELLAHREVAVAMVDDRGQAIADGVVEFTTRPPGAGKFQSCRDQVRLDPAGRASLRILAGEAPTLVFSSPGHAPARRQLAAGETSLEVVLPRLGFVAGHLAEFELTRHCRLVVRAKSAKGVEIAHGDVDRSGRYWLALEPGDNTIDLTVVDGTHLTSNECPVPDPVPLVADFESVGPATPVTVRSGETTNVALAAPVFGELTGRVLVAGRPLAGAIVFAELQRDQPRDRRQRQMIQSRDRHTYFPHQRTDAAGTFRFLLSRGSTVKVQARHGGSGEWSPPVAVTVAAGERRQIDLGLSAAAIRGRFELAEVPLRERAFLVAWLGPVAEADSDAGSFDLEASLRLRLQRPECRLDANGNFAFECLPPGGYVVRVGDGYGPRLVQRIVYTTGDEVHDLGVLTTEPRFAVRLAAEPLLDGWRWVEVMLATPGNARGVLVGTGTVYDGKLDLGQLPAGTYRLLLLANEGSSPGRTEGSADLTVGDDGVVSPPRVTFRLH
ncbi:MAG: hypothetical protein MUC36_27375 [Planctomycetes bacterium]|nr:hypothetical protein [Planctomycetota bacterium]